MQIKTARYIFFIASIGQKPLELYANDNELIFLWNVDWNRYAAARVELFCCIMQGFVIYETCKKWSTHKGLTGLWRMCVDSGEPPAVC